MLTEVKVFVPLFNHEAQEFNLSFHAEVLSWVVFTEGLQSRQRSATGTHPLMEP